MSRGLGRTQRTIVQALEGAESLWPSELRRCIGSCHGERQNVRKSVRGLVDRSLVEEDAKGRLRFTERGRLILMLEELDEEERREREEKRHNDEAWAAFGAALKEVTRRKFHRKEEEDALWVDGRRPIKRRRWSFAQYHMLEIVREHADPPQRGMEVREVKKLTGGDRSNLRRVIRSLCYRGELQESVDKKSVRIGPGSFWAVMEGYYKIEPASADEALEILRKWGWHVEGEEEGGPNVVG